MKDIQVNIVTLHQKKIRNYARLESISGTPLDSDPV